MFRKLFNPYARLTGQEVELRFSERSTRDRASGIPESITYDIFLQGSRVYVGYISLRLGESPEIYYLGHIGYRVEEAWRGHGYAAKALRALLPLIRAEGFHSLSITTDPDNIPSRKTCEKLGCELESIVKVPARYRALCMNSPAKCRYILRLAPEDAGGENAHDPAV
ncbi:MAG TPA: GNAT family N-acetyltransferase [Clostridia bacterium]|nr:GNAT family N-acetyltransferase [Clostridia bacterium]